MTEAESMRQPGVWRSAKTSELRDERSWDTDDMKDVTKTMFVSGLLFLYEI